MAGLTPLVRVDINTLRDRAASAPDPHPNMGLVGCSPTLHVELCHHLAVNNVDLGRRTRTGATGARAWRVSAIRGYQTRPLHNNIKFYLLREQYYFDNYRI